MQVRAIFRELLGNDVYTGATLKFSEDTRVGQVKGEGLSLSFPFLSSVRVRPVIAALPPACFKLETEGMARFGWVNWGRPHRKEKKMG